MTTRCCSNLPACTGIRIERLHGGAPILAPTAHWWESGVTFNAAAIYLARSPNNDLLIARLLGADALIDPRVRDGVVVAHYRARPYHDPGFRFTRSYTGIAVFTPDTAHLLYRGEAPVVTPCAVGDDCLGVEDPRITPLGDTYYMIYCGVAPAGRRWKANLCLARSRDLLAWEKLGAMRGEINTPNNKDGVLFPEPVDGQYLLLHRPMRGSMSMWAMHLAVSDAPDGIWRDCGQVLAAPRQPRCRSSWVGAGSVPIPLGDGRYLVIFHTGNVLRDGRRQYNLDAAIFTLRRFDPARPEMIVESRLDRIMVPETPCEVDGPYPESVANVLFTCGSYVYNGDLYILYGGGDTYVMGARLPLNELLERLAGCGVEYALN